jgi:hypothetical protein
MQQIFHTAILVLQVVLTLSLGVYLFIPAYDFTKSLFDPSVHTYNPYRFWDHSPLHKISVHQHQMVLSSGETIAQLHPLVSGTFSSTVTFKPFISHILAWGTSDYSTQFLFNSIQRQDPSSKIILTDTAKDYSYFFGIDLIAIRSPEEMDRVIPFLEKDKEIHAIAVSSPSYKAINLVPFDPNQESMIDSLFHGFNLMQFTAVHQPEIEQIPVIHALQFSKDRIFCEFSEPGRLILKSDDFWLDTLCQRISIKAEQPDWTVFSINFEDHGVTYVGNPVLSETAFTKAHILPPDNIKTVFINLLWLLGLIGINLLISRFRRWLNHLYET